MRSIRGRLLLLAALWLPVALLAGFLVISGLLKDFITDRFDAEAGVMADALTASIGVNAQGQVELPSQPNDPRYTLPFSGWYWQISTGGRIVARSDSLLDARLKGPTGNFAGGPGKDQDGASLRISRREISIPEREARIAITVTAPQTEIDSSLQQIIQPLGIALAVLGIGLALASILQVSLGLRSLDLLREDLARVRAGSAKRLRLPDVSELRPLTREINAGLDQQAELLDRSRQHLGNLAHSLRTPLAAMANELPADHDSQPLISRMDRLIGWHLRRARSAGSGRLGEHTAIRSVIDDILLVLRWPIKSKGLTVLLDCPETALFAGERQDLEEMIGNLTDNAVKWGRNRISINVRSGSDTVTIRIEDDGPGMPETEAPLALLRGGRLDEQGLSGSGLGLAIVVDLAGFLGGDLSLERAELGGVAAVLNLPV